MFVWDGNIINYGPIKNSKEILFIFISKFTKQSFSHRFSLILLLGFKACNLCLCICVLSFQCSRFSVLGSVTACFWECGCSWMQALSIRLLARPGVGWSFCLSPCASFIAFWISFPFIFLKIMFLPGFSAGLSRTIFLCDLFRPSCSPSTSTFILTPHNSTSWDQMELGSWVSTFPPYLLSPFFLFEVYWWRSTLLFR